MLSRDEVSLIEHYETQNHLQWLSRACVDSNTLTALCNTAAAVVRKQTPERLENLDKLIKQLHNMGIYSVETVLKNIDMNIVMNHIKE